jgi:protein-S-isoprenylcysteine O-methyltransferase Ste14
MLARHLMAIAVLPLTVTVLVPLSIARRYRLFVAVGEDPLQVLVQLIGIAVIVVGLVLFGASLRHFVVQGRGTLAPWDPPKNLVVDGPYRYVRNPMISGVLFIVSGEALTLLSWPHGQWALLFFVINLVYIPLIEEPQLQGRFGGAYHEYCRNVRRFLPRLRPWVPPGHASTRAADS